MFLSFAYQMITELKWTQSRDEHQVYQVRSDPGTSHLTGRHDEIKNLLSYEHLAVSSKFEVNGQKPRGVTAEMQG
jgi:hypothetical protein